MYASNTGVHRPHRHERNDYVWYHDTKNQKLKGMLNIDMKFSLLILFSGYL